MTETYTYDANSYLTAITMGGQKVWELKSNTGTQRTVHLGTTPLVLTTSYDFNGLPKSSIMKRGSTTLHSFGYTFDGATGNLKSRTGMQSGTENFTYDTFDRLTTGTSYYLNGNINSKTGIGKYTYDATKKHAVVQVENTSNLIQGAASLTYNTFNKVATVVQGTNTLTITYGPDRQRTKTVLVNGSNTTTTLYADNYEQRTANGVTTTYHYVASPDGLAAVYIKSGSTATAYYIETDHLGSIINLFDASGTKQFSATYDAWGKQTITKNNVGITRGYTGHEHWNQFGLIDMNGRFYDPLLGRFLSPDPYVQAPENPQNFNRYSYCLNNPLKYTDPSGEWILTWAISKCGFSVGVNFAPYPFGFGINVDWSNGFSLGVYGEIGERAGGTGFGTGIYADQGFSYNFKHNEWNTFASEGAYASAGPFSIGGSLSQNYNMTQNEFSFGWNVGVGIGFGTKPNYVPTEYDATNGLPTKGYRSIGGLSLGIGYGSDGWNWNIGGNYERVKTHYKNISLYLNSEGKTCVEGTKYWEENNPNYIKENLSTKMSKDISNVNIPIPDDVLINRYNISNKEYMVSIYDNNINIIAGNNRTDTRITVYGSQARIAMPRLEFLWKTRKIRRF